VPRLPLVGEERLDAIGHEELGVDRPVEVLLRGGDFLDAERIGVGLGVPWSLGDPLP